MSRTAVIVDTNAIVVGLLTEHRASPVSRILDGRAELLVTGDKLLLLDPVMEGRVISPAASVFLLNT